MTSILRGSLVATPAFRLSLIALAVVASSACSIGGQSGGEVGEPPAESPVVVSLCEETRETLADAATVSELGFSAGQIVDFASGEHAAALTWFDPESKSVTFTSDAAGSTLTCEVRYKGTPPVFVRSKPTAGGSNGDVSPTLARSPGAGGDPGTESALRCSDHVEVKVELRITTSGGALAEKLDGLLTATGPEAATLLASLGAAQIQGTLGLALTADAPKDSKLEPVTWQSIVAKDGGFSGEVSTGLEVQAGSSGQPSIVSRQPLRLASWDSSVP